MKYLALILLLLMLPAVPVTGVEPVLVDDFDFLDISKWEVDDDFQVQSGKAILSGSEMRSLQTFMIPINVTFDIPYVSSDAGRIRFGLMAGSKSYGTYIIHKSGEWHAVSRSHSDYQKFPIEAIRGVCRVVISTSGETADFYVNGISIAKLKQSSHTGEFRVFAETSSKGRIEIDRISLGTSIIEGDEEDPITPDITDDQREDNNVTAGRIYRVAAIWVGFNDTQIGVSNETLKDYFSIVNDYFREATYNEIGFAFDLFGPYTLNHSLAYYGADGRYYRDDSDNDGTSNVLWLARDAVEISDPDINFLKYNLTMFIHAGIGQESDPRRSDAIWSVYMNLGSHWTSIITDDFTRISTLTCVPESEIGGLPPGVYAHELAHELGLYDNYHLEFWSLMGRSGFMGNPPGTSPAHLLAYEKQLLGVLPNGGLLELSRGLRQYVRIYPQVYGNDTILVGAGQYYIEVRERTGYDSYLPKEGVLVYKSTSFGAFIHIIDGGRDTRWDISDATMQPGEWVNTGPVRVLVLERHTDGSYTVEIDYR